MTAQICVQMFVVSGVVPPYPDRIFYTMATISCQLTMANKSYIALGVEQTSYH